jgi:flagellar export protein FliJ
MALKRLQRIVSLPKFHFTLETLLRHRDAVEQKERDELMRRTYKHQLELNHRDEIKAKSLQIMQELVQKQAENPEHHELASYFLYLSRLNHEMDECEKRLSQLQSEVQAQTEAVIQASIKRKTLASMKDKKKKEFVDAQEKIYQKEIDDLVVTRYTRKNPDHPNGT